MTASPEFRAAGTDLSERRRSGVSKGPMIDIVAAAESRHAMGRGRHAAHRRLHHDRCDRRRRRIAAAYPGIAAAAQGLATPQIRHLATLGGNLAQRSRCWYFRNPHIACLKKGGTDCPARSGNHLYHVAFDLGPCVAPHPSTMAAALLAYDATVITDTRSGLSIAGCARRRQQRRRRQRAAAGRNDPRHRTARAAAGERAFYKRAISRTPCGVAAGRSLRPRCREGRRVPVHPSRRRRHRAGAVAARRRGSRVARRAGKCAEHRKRRKARTSGAKPLPMTGYKLDLLEGVVRDLLEKLAA